MPVKSKILRYTKDQAGQQGTEEPTVMRTKAVAKAATMKGQGLRQRIAESQRKAKTEAKHLHRLAWRKAKRKEVVNGDTR
jgi:hypothetical protein